MLNDAASPGRRTEVTARPVSVWVTPGGYGFDERAGGRWVALSDKLRVVQWTNGIQAVSSGTGGRDTGVWPWPCIGSLPPS